MVKKCTKPYSLPGGINKHSHRSSVTKILLARHFSTSKTTANHALVTAGLHQPFTNTQCTKYYYLWSEYYSTSVTTNKLKDSHSSALTFHMLQATTRVSLLPESQWPATEPSASSVCNSFTPVTQILRKSTSPF